MESCFFIDEDPDGQVSYPELIQRLESFPATTHDVAPLMPPVLPHATDSQDLLRQIVHMLYGLLQDAGVAHLKAAWGTRDLNRWRNAFLNAAGRVAIQTSGTTGRPKTFWHDVSTLMRGIRPGDHHRANRWALAYPVDRFAGVQVLLQALVNQNPVVPVFGHSSQRFHHAITTHQLTHLSCTPTQLRMLLSAPVVQPTIIRLTAGGEKWDAALAGQVSTVFPNAKLTNVYASTEAGVIMVASGDVFAVRAELEDKVRIVDNQLMLHPSLLAQGVIEPSADSDAYYPTGDRVELIARRPLTLRFLARQDHIINVAGHKVDPTEVESIVLTFPGVTAVRVYGQANSVTGQIVCCDVVVSRSEHRPDFRDSDSVPQDQALLQQVRVFLSDRLRPFQRPRLIRIVDHISTTASGKVLRS